MPRHKKVTKQDISKIERWLAEDYQARQNDGRACWEKGKDIICKWGVYEENNSYSVKRFIRFKDGGSTWQRLKKPFYREFLQSKRELDNLATYLNGLDPAEVKAGIKYKLKESYIPRTHILNFCRTIKANFLNDDKKDIENRLNSFINYGLNWFQDQKTPKVNEWKKFEKRWGQCLLNYSNDIKDSERIFPKGELRSKNTIVRVIWLMNQFMEYLHEQYPNKYPPTRFSPISNSQFRSLEKLRKAHNLVKKRGHISEEHWLTIRDRIREDEHLKIVELCYEFGLRRSEALALSVNENMYIDNLYIKQQVKSLDYTEEPPRKILKPTKTGEPRRISYAVSINNLSTREIENIIRTAQPISPNQLTKKWRKLQNELGFEYDIHDCRHSFARYIVQELDLKQAMEYLGHLSIQTTNGYIQSKDELSVEKYTPNHLEEVA